MSDDDDDDNKHDDDDDQLHFDFERGMSESRRSAYARWTEEQISEVRATIRWAADRHGQFTTDHVWRELGPTFPFSKGIGSQLNAVAREGYIRSTGILTYSRRGGDHGHAQRLTVWEKT